MDIAVELWIKSLMIPSIQAVAEESSMGVEAAAIMEVVAVVGGL